LSKVIDEGVLPEIEWSCVMLQLSLLAGASIV
jgi:hypothetical protein